MNLRSVVTRGNYIRRFVAHGLIFKPSLTALLSDVCYDLPEGDPSEAVDASSNELREIDAPWIDSRCPVASEIGAGIQYCSLQTP